MRIVLGEYLEKQKITITWLSDKTGIRYATLISYIHNHSKSMKNHHIKEIMKALKINDVNLLLKLEDEEAEESCENIQNVS